MLLNIFMIRKLFYFSKNQRRGIFVFMLIIIFIIILTYLV